MNKIVKKYLMGLELNAHKKNSDNILKLLPEIEGDVSILDLGCDDGSWTKALGKKYNNPSLFGVEIVQESLNKAIENGVKVKSFDLNGKFDFESDFFDLVHSNQVIEHLYDTDSFISEVYRVLKPGGHFMVSTVSLSSWHNIFSLLIGYQPFDLSNISVRGNVGNPFSLWNNIESNKSKLRSWQHLRLFTIYSLSDLLKKYNFSILSTLASGYYPLPNVFSKIDKGHSHYFVIKAVK